MSASSFRASSRGKRIGLIAASAGRTQALIHVAPKTFEGERTTDVALPSWSAGGLNRVGLTETQRLHVYDDPARTFMDDLVGRLSEKAEAHRGTGGSTRGSVESLLSQTSTPVTFRAPPRASQSPSDDSESEVVDLLNLLDNTGFLDLDSEAVDGIDRSAPLLRPLLVRRFLDEFGRRMQQTRRGYRTVTERRSVVRGRVSSSSLAQLQATGVPRLTCTYDELTESTELLRVMSTALEAIAEGRGRSSVFPGRYAESSLRGDAVVYRRVFESVDPLPARSALAVGGRLRLSRLDQPWATALRLALRILASIQAEPANAGLELDAAEVSVETEKIWERIVTAALQRMNPRLEVLTPKELSAANRSHPLREKMWWVTPEPDNVVVRDADMLVFDAKYKRAGTKPGRDDEYQMFAYSHLIGRESQPTTVLALVYPTNETAPAMEISEDPGNAEIEPDEREVTAVHGGGIPQGLRGGAVCGSAEAPALFMLKLPFPGPADLRPGAWPRYIDDLAKRLEAFITGTDAERALR